MVSDILQALHERIEDDLDGLALTPEGLRAVTDARWGETTLQIDYDEEASCIRVSVAVPPPAGAGPELLVWCLSMNAQYFDVKLALDDEGQLLVHGDIDVDEREVGEVAPNVVDTAESVIGFVDDDLVEWCLSRGLGTPAQRLRWGHRVPEGAS
ncbi:MAG: YbjN domain-containing protein [Myxococcota bacterium]